MKRLSLVVFLTVAFCMVFAPAAPAMHLKPKGAQSKPQYLLPEARVADGQYDFSSVLFRGGIEKLAGDWPRIYVSGRQVVTRKNSAGEVEEMQEEKSQSGRAIIIPPYVIALHHIVDISKISTMILTPFGPQAIEFPADEVRNTSYWLQEDETSGRKVSLELLSVVPEMDLAFFKMPDTPVQHAEFVLGNSAELRLLHTVIVLGSPGLTGINVRLGVVSALYSDFNKEWLKERASKAEFGTFVKGAVGISVPVLPGDSGSPVVALRDGLPELVGIVNAQFLGVLGMMIPINEVLDAFTRSTGRTDPRDRAYVP